MRDVNNASTRQIELVGEGTVTEFSIAANGHAFRTLIDSLYSDKVGSVIREVIANAVDAHAMHEARTGAPINAAIQVNLPTMFERTFSVRDYGPGMADEFVKEMYTTLFHSEKKRTNVATGKFGLGAKSPFAISDQFEVRVYRDGVERIYPMFINASGVPSVREIPAQKTIERDGVLVKIPVKPEMTSSFDTCVRQQGLAFFDKNVVFNRRISSNDAYEAMALFNNTIKNFVPGLFLVGTPRGYGSSQMMKVRQGTAVYPLDITFFKKLQRPEERALLNILAGTAENLMFDAPIGTFEITPSREALAYDAASVASLEKFLCATLDLASTKLAKVFLGCDTIHSAYVAYANSISTPKEVEKFETTRLNSAAAMQTIFMPIVRENHKKLVDAGKREDKPLSKECIIRTDEAPAGTRMYHGSAQYHAPNLPLRAIALMPTKYASIPVISVVFVIPNNVRDWTLRVSKWVQANCPYSTKTRSVSVYVIRMKKADVETYTKTLDKVFITHLIGHEELPELNASDYAVDQQGTQTHTRKRHSKTAVFEAVSSSSTSGLSWSKEKVERDLGTLAYYVHRNGAKYDNVFGTDAVRTAYNNAGHGAVKGGMPGLKAPETMSNSDMFELISLARTLKLIEETSPIYRVTEQQAVKMETESHEWINVADLIMKNVTDKIVADAIQALKRTYISQMNVAVTLTPSYVSLLRTADVSAEFRSLDTAISSLLETDLGATSIGMSLGARWTGGGSLPSMVDCRSVPRHEAHAANLVSILDNAAHVTVTTSGAYVVNRRPLMNMIPQSTRDELDQIEKLIPELIPLIEDQGKFAGTTASHVAAYVKMALSEKTEATTYKVNDPIIKEIIKEVRAQYQNTSDRAKKALSGATVTDLAA